MHRNDRPIETLIPERDATPRQNRISSPGQGNSFSHKMSLIGQASLFVYLRTIPA
jgi:hypothetical protein